MPRTSSRRTIEDEVASDEIRDVEQDLKGISDIGKELRDLKKTVESPIESTVKKVLDLPAETTRVHRRRRRQGNRELRRA